MTSSFLSDHLPPSFRELENGALNWHNWSNECFTLAQEHNKPLCVVLISSLDWWGLEMLNAWQKDEEVCELTNSAFVPVLVEERAHPALHLRLQEQLSLSAGAQGSPIIAFFTPQKRPFAALPYRPIRDQDRQEGLVHSLLAIAQLWQERAADVEADAEQMRGAWQAIPQALRTAMPKQNDTLTEIYEKTCAKDELLFGVLEAHAMERANSLEGGIGEAPWQLPIPVLSFLLGRSNPNVQKQVSKTLDALIMGAQHDHLAGGFFRGTLDPAWHLPFFEKRLSDQAHIALLLLDAARIQNRPFYYSIACSTLHWAISVLRRSDNFFTRGLTATSTGANQQAINGAYYLWNEAAAAERIGSEAATRFSALYLPAENTDEWQCPARHGTDSQEDDNTDFSKHLYRLAAARSERPAPERDERIFLEEQLLMLAALKKVQYFADDFIEQQSDLSDELESFSQCADALHQVINETIIKENGNISYRGKYLAQRLGILPAQTLSNIFNSIQENTDNDLLVDPVFNILDNLYEPSLLALALRPQEHADLQSPEAMALACAVRQLARQAPGNFCACFTSLGYY